VAFTQADLDRVEAALASGTLEINYGDKGIVRFKFKELVELRNLIKKELENAQNGAAPRQTFGDFNSGHYPNNRR